MKNALFGFVLVCLMFSGLTSCDPAVTYKKEIAELDSCINLVDSLQTVFDGIEFDSLQLMFNHTINNEDVIKRLYKSDSVNQLLASQMNEAKSVRKAFKHLDSEKSNMETDLILSKGQLESLRTDVLAGVLNEEQIKQYLGVEKEAVNNLRMVVTDFDQLQKVQKNRYYYYSPGMDAFVDKLIEETKVEE